MNQPIETDSQKQLNCIHLVPSQVMGGVQYLGADYGAGTSSKTVRITMQLCPRCSRRIYDQLKAIAGASYTV